MCHSFVRFFFKKLFNFFTTLDDRKYIYYALAYSGLRPSELWKCKISTSKDNIIYFDLTDKDLQLKTMSSYRVIPLHNKLLEMGIDKNYLHSSYNLHKQELAPTLIKPSSQQLQIIQIK